MKLTLTIFSLILMAGIVCADPVSVTIAHLNDTHAHLNDTEVSMYFDIDIDGDNQVENTKTKVDIGGFPRIATKVNQLAADYDNFMFLNAGDVFQGTLYFTLFEGMADLWFLEYMNLDAMCTGNHEFDQGPETLANFVTEADFPVLCANADFSQEPVLNGLIAPYQVFTYDGEEIAVIGLTIEETPMISSPGPNITFEDRISATQTAISDLNGQGVNKIIVLSHCGYSQDIELAEAVDGIDIIIGGHSHTMMGSSDDFNEIGLSPSHMYPEVVNSPNGDPVYVVQAWEHGKLLGIVQLDFDASGSIENYVGMPTVITGESYRPQINGEYVEVSPDNLPEVYNQLMDIVDNNPVIEIVAADATAQAQLDIYSEDVNEMYETVIAQVPVDLPHVRVPGWEYSGNNLPEGSHIAPIVCDGMYWKAEMVGLEPDVVVQNAGGVRISIGAPECTIGHAYELMPFGNTLVAMDMTGAQLQQSLIEGISNAVGRGTGAFPYVAGCRYDINGSDPGNIIVNSIEVIDDNGNYVALNPTQTYRVVTNAFIAYGGDGYATFGEVAGSGGYFYDTGFVDAETFVDYCEEVGTLTFPDDGRITFQAPVDADETDVPDAPVNQSFQNFPNPFNPTTSIKFAVGDNNLPVTVEIFNIRGQLVRTLIDAEHLAKGFHTRVWDGVNNAGTGCSSGTYFYRVQIGSDVFNHKMLLLK